MATAQQVEKLKATLTSLAEELKKELIARPEWGAITFENSSPDLKKLRDLVGYLRVLPLEYIPDGTMPQIDQHLSAALPTLKAMDAFSITSGNPPGPQRDSLATQLHQQTDTLVAVSGQWIPFLAYQRGDVAKNIDQLSKAADEGRQLVESAKADAQAKAAEISAIISAAREASAAAGAAVFTSDFAEESKSLETSARRWLKAAASLAAATLVAALLFLWLAYLPTGVAAASQPLPAPASTAGVGPVQVAAAATANGAPTTGGSPAMSTPQLAQAIGAKLIIVTLLLTAATWCGRNYKAQKHLAAVNRHRSLSLRTLKAFSAAASDDLTKNAVLLEATRAIFGAGSTGYLDGKDGSDDSSLKIVEIAKGFGVRPSGSA